METLKASGAQKAALIAASVNRAEFIVAFGRVGVGVLPLLLGRLPKPFICE